MFKKIRKVLISCTLVALIVVQSIPMNSIYAQETKKEDSSSFTKLELRQGSLNGPVIADLLSTDTNWKLTSDQDYYLYGEVLKPEDNSNSYLQIRFGAPQEDGTITYNGVTYFNPPGGTYEPGTIEHDYFDRLQSFDPIADPTYGTNSGKLNLQDGVMTYHIKDAVPVNSTVSFAMGLVVNDALMSDKTTLLDAIKVSVGTLQNNVYTPKSSKTIDLQMEAKGQLYSYCNNNTASATLNGDGAVLTDYIKEKDTTKQTSLLYKKLEFDIVYPKNANFTDIGFTSTYVKEHTYLGTLSYSEPQINGDTKTIHVTIKDGYKSKTSSISFLYSLNFTSPDYKDGDTAETTISNIKFTMHDGELIDAEEPTKAANYTILDPSLDNTTMASYNRAALYNHAIDSNQPYMTNFGGTLIANKSVSENTPEDKIFEADYNTTKTAANISGITIPTGTNYNPTIELTGVDAQGNEVVVTVENPSQYTPTKKIETSTYILLLAQDFGMISITHVKAEIGKLRPNYRSSGWTSSFEFSSNCSSAYGYFTTKELGVLVKNTYHLYNSDPAKRDLQNGDLMVSTTATSTDNDRVGISGDSVYIRDDNNAVVDSVAAGNAVTLKGNLYPYSVPGAAIDASKNMATTATIIDPVIYLTLPQGMNYEDVSFTLTKKNRYNVTTYTPITYNIENISYMNKTGDGAIIYKVTFPKGTVFGYYNIDGSYTQLSYNIKLRTSKSMQTKRYELNSLVGITSQDNAEALPYSGNPTILNTIVQDKYSINQGLNYAGISKGTAINQEGFGLQQLAEINVYNAVSVTKINGKAVDEKWYAYDVSDPNSIAVLGKNSEGRFKLDVKNTSDSPSGILQIVVPIPQKGVDLGNVFMDGASQSDMNITWDNTTLPEGFKANYVKVEAVDELVSEFVYTESSQAEANAILLTKDSVNAKEESSVYFDFVMKDGNAKDLNIFRNAFLYQTSDNETRYKTGSYVASAVADSSLSGIVYQDDNRNGVMDKEEKGIAGVNVVVKDSNHKIQSIITDENGYYEFLAVRESDATLSFTLDSSKSYRFNVPQSEIEFSSDYLNATKSYATIAQEETLNVPVSNFYTLTYNANKANGNLPSVGEYVPGSKASVSVKPDNLLLNGYVFKEWNTKSDGTGTGYQPGETITMGENQNLFAIWDIGTFNIYFNYRGATGNTDVSEKQLKHYETYNTNGNLPTPTKTGYNFLGWATTTTATSANVSDTTKFVLGSDTTLYALWSPKTDFTVIYDTKGGSAVPQSKVSWNDSVSTSEKPTKNGYEFSGWKYGSIDINDKTIYSELVSDDTITSLTLIAVWTPKSNYTVSYDLNGAEGSVDSKTVKWNESALLPIKNPTRKGYAFKGWTYLEQNVTNTTTYEYLVNNDTITSISLKAVWEELSDNTVLYDTQGGNIITDKTGVKTTDQNLLPTEQPKRAGYEFVNWMYNGVEVTNDTKYVDLTQDTSVTLTAQWLEKEYTISYDSSVNSINKKWSEDNLLPSSDPTKAGSVFAGWYYGTTKITSTTTVSDLIPLDDASVDVISLQAKWTNLMYTVVYDSNGGNYFAPKPNVIYDADELLPETTPVRLGYSFQGWYMDDVKVNNSTTMGSLLKDGDTSVSLKATWKAKTGFVVKYNTTGGTAIPSKTNVTWTDKNLLPENPTRIGYTFTGWISGRTSVSKDSIYSSLATSDADGSSITLVAQWKLTSMTVIYDSQGGTKFNNKENVTISDANLLPQIAPEKEGSLFDGWYYGNTKVTKDTIYEDLTLDTTLTLTAHWINSPFLVQNHTKVTLKNNDSGLRGIKYMYTTDPYSYTTWYNYYMSGRKQIEMNGADGYRTLNGTVNGTASTLDNRLLSFEKEGYYTFIMTASNGKEKIYTLHVSADDVAYGKPSIRKSGNKVTLVNNESGLQAVKYMYTPQDYTYTTWYNFYTSGQLHRDINTSLGYRALNGVVTQQHSSLDGQEITLERGGYYTFLLSYDKKAEIAYTVFIDEETRQLEKPSITAGTNTISVETKKGQSYILLDKDSQKEIYKASEDGTYTFKNLQQGTSYRIYTEMIDTTPIEENGIFITYTKSEDSVTSTSFDRPFIENVANEILSDNTAVFANAEHVTGIIYQYSGKDPFTYSSWYSFVNNGLKDTITNGKQGYRSLNQKNNQGDTLNGYQLALTKEGWYTFIYRVEVNDTTKEVIERVYVSNDSKGSLNASNFKISYQDNLTSGTITRYAYQYIGASEPDVNTQMVADETQTMNIKRNKESKGAFSFVVDKEGWYLAEVSDSIMGTQKFKIQVVFQGNDDSHQPILSIDGMNIKAISSTSTMKFIGLSESTLIKGNELKVGRNGIYDVYVIDDRGNRYVLKANVDTIEQGGAINAQKLQDALNTALSLRNSDAYRMITSKEEATETGSYMLIQDRDILDQAIQDAQHALSNYQSQSEVDSAYQAMTRAMSDYKAKEIRIDAELVSVDKDTIRIHPSNQDYRLNSVTYNTDEENKLKPSVWKSWAGITSEKFVSNKKFDDDGSLLFDQVNDGIYTFFVSQKEGDRTKEYVQYAIVASNSSKQSVVRTELAIWITKTQEYLQSHKKESQATVGERYISDTLYNAMSNEVKHAQALQEGSDIYKEYIPSILNMKQNLTNAGDGKIKEDTTLEKASIIIDAGNVSIQSKDASIVYISYGKYTNWSSLAASDYKTLQMKEGSCTYNASYNGAYTALIHYANGTEEFMYFDISGIVYPYTLTQEKGMITLSASDVSSIDSVYYGYGEEFKDHLDKDVMAVDISKSKIEFQSLGNGKHTIFVKMKNGLLYRSTLDVNTSEGPIVIAYQDGIGVFAHGFDIISVAYAYGEFSDWDSMYGQSSYTTMNTWLSKNQFKQGIVTFCFKDRDGKEYFKTIVIE